MNRIAIATLGVFLFALGPASRAFSKEISDSELQAKTYKGIPYISGGFGVDERETLREMGKTDNLKLSFALQNRNYLGGADVLIKDDHGNEILKAVADGPLFFTQLPAGKYTIDATAEGRTEKQVAQVPAKGQTRIYFDWKNSMAKPQI